VRWDVYKLHEAGMRPTQLSNDWFEDGVDEILGRAKMYFKLYLGVKRLPSSSKQDRSQLRFKREGV
jgi:hypothetical protein